MTIDGPRDGLSRIARRGATREPLLGGIEGLGESLLACSLFPLGDRQGHGRHLPHLGLHHQELGSKRGDSLRLSLGDAGDESDLRLGLGEVALRQCHLGPKLHSSRIMSTGGHLCRSALRSGEHDGACDGNRNRGRREARDGQRELPGHLISFHSISPPRRTGPMATCQRRARRYEVIARRRSRRQDARSSVRAFHGGRRLDSQVPAAGGRGCFPTEENRVRPYIRPTRETVHPTAHGGILRPLLLPGEGRACSPAAPPEAP